MSEKKKTILQWVVAVASITVVVGLAVAFYLWASAQTPEKQTAEVTEQLEPASALLLLAEPMTSSGSVELPEGQSLVIAEKGDNLNYLSPAWTVSEVQEGLTVVTTDAQRKVGEPFVMELAEPGEYGFTLVNESQDRAYQITVTRDDGATLVETEAPEETPAP